MLPVMYAAGSLLVDVVTVVMDVVIAAVVAVVAAL